MNRLSDPTFPTVLNRRFLGDLRCHALMAVVLQYLLLAGSVSGKPTAEEDFAAVRAGMAAANFKPVVPAAQSGTASQYFAGKAAWLKRSFLPEMKQRTQGKPWAAAAVTQAERLLDLIQSSRFMDYSLAEEAPAVRKLLKDGADDPLFLMLAATCLEATVGMPGEDPKEIWPVLDRAVRAFESGSCSRLIGVYLYFLQIRMLPQGVDDERDKLYVKGAKCLLASRKEPGVWTEAQTGIYVDLVRRQFGKDVARAKKAAFEPLYRDAALPEWARETLAGFWELDLAWEARGPGFVNEVTPDGWKEFSARQKTAAAHLEKAWRLEPKEPYAANGMITVCMAESMYGTTREWFDRCVNARVDYQPAWDTYSWSLRPRWGGNVPSMIALGLAAVECRRFDTNLPFASLELFQEVTDELFKFDAIRNFWKSPRVAASLSLIGKGYARRVEKPRSKAALAWWTASLTWLAGRLDETHEAMAIAKGHPMPTGARWKISGYHMDEISLEGESALFMANLLEKWTAADARYLKLDLPGTKASLAELASAPAAAQPMIRRLASLVDTEQALADGKWVTLEPGKDVNQCLHLAGYRWNSDGKDVPARGWLERGLLIHRAKIGPNFEARGTIRSADPNMKTIGGGIAFVHRASSSGAGYWVTAELYRDAKNPGQARVAILQGHAASVIPTKSIPMDFSKPIEWTLRLSGDRLIWTVNGQEIHRELLLTQDGGLDGKYKATPNGRMGWSSRILPSQAPMIFSPIEVRRLPSASPPQPDRGLGPD